MEIEIAQALFASLTHSPAWVYKREVELLDTIQVRNKKAGQSGCRTVGAPVVLGA